MERPTPRAFSLDLKEALNRYANICMGLCWSHRIDWNTARIQTSFATSALCLHLGIEASVIVEDTIKQSIDNATQVFYNSNGTFRDPPIVGSYLLFKQT